MKFAVIIVIAIGIAIGLSAPRGNSAAMPVAAATPDSAPTPLVAHVTAAPSPAPTYSADTVLTRDPSGHFFADADVNGTSVHFVVDTGASIVALTQDDARRVGVMFDPSKFQVVGTGASGEVHGQLVQLNDVVLDGKRVDHVEAMVLDGLTVSLLGQNYLRHLNNVSINGDAMTLN